MWGAEVKAVSVGLPQGGSLWFEALTKGWAPADAGYWGMYIDKLDVVAALVAAALVAGLTLFSLSHLDRAGAPGRGGRPSGGAVGRDQPPRSGSSSGRSPGWSRSSPG